VRDERALEAARAGFTEALDRLGPALPSDVRVELDTEAAPVLEALLAMERSGERSDQHETLTLAALFGRRVATLRQSPTVALAAIDAVIDAMTTVGLALEDRLCRSLRAAAREGFATAVDERARAEMIERAGRSLTPVTVSPRVLLLVIAGCDDAETIARALARLGRAALDADAKACLVHASFAHEPDRDVVAEIAAFDGSAQMIGARAIFSGSPLLLHALGAHASTLAIATTFEDAIRRGLEAAEQEVRPASLLARSLKRLRG